MKFHKTIIFSKTPLKGKFKFKDIFQIYPCDIDGTPNSALQKHYPIILEFTTDESETITQDYGSETVNEWAGDLATSTVKQDLIITLLTVVTNHHFFRYEEISGNWGVPILDDNPKNEVANTWESKWNLNLFIWPDMKNHMTINEFSNKRIDLVSLIDYQTYYYFKPNLDLNQGEEITEITFPNSINKILDSYFSLTPEELSVINLAIDHASNSFELFNKKKTISMIATFTAIETMIQYEYSNVKNKHCKECNQLMYKISHRSVCRWIFSPVAAVFFTISLLRSKYELTNFS